MTAHKRTLLRRSLLASLVFALAMALSSCAQPPGPADRVEAYYQAIVDKDRDRFINLICADFEREAMLEFDSFSTVEARLEGLSCEQTATEGDSAVVECQGGILVTYEGEDNRLFSMESNTYHVVQEAGEWRMCGYE